MLEQAAHWSSMGNWLDWQLPLNVRSSNNGRETTTDTITLVTACLANYFSYYAF